MAYDAATEQFIQLLTRHQTNIYGYIYSLHPCRTQAEDILQETNLTIWRKKSDYVTDTDFGAWACKIAYYKLLAHRRRQSREHLVFDDEVLDFLAERMSERNEELSGRKELLHACLAKLDDRARDLVQRRYTDCDSVKEMARRLNRSVGSISQTLYRIRMALLACIERGLSREGGR